MAAAAEFIIAAVFALIQGGCGQDCPCELRGADPLFPGAEGQRWDCQYVVHGLTDVPSACWDLQPNVTQVFLDYNDISEVGVGSLEALINLKTLSLKQNNIASVDDQVLAALDQLEFLDLSGNSFSVPPTDIWGLTRLTQLYLGDNQLGEVETYRISDLVNLEVLDLHLNGLAQIPYYSLEPLTNLRELHLYWNMIVVLPVLSKNLQLEQVLVHGNALVEFPKYVFGNLTKPLTYHFVDNPAYDVWGTMLLPLPDRSHIVMGRDVAVWVEDAQQAQQLLQKDWVVQDGLGVPIDLSTLVRVCGTAAGRHHTRVPPC